MMFLRYGCLLTLLLWSATLASADFYRYSDAQGNPVFTDDLNKVPEDRRDQVRIFKSQSTGDETRPRVPPELQRIVESSENPTTDARATKRRDNSAEDRLEEKKQIYQELIAERERLAEQKKLLDIRYNTRNRKPVTRAQRNSLEERLAVVEGLINHFEW